MRVLGIDFGKARLGIALSDPSQMLASPLPFIKASQSMADTIDSILKLIKEKGPVVKIVVGLPLHMSGHESPMSKLAREFSDQLEKASQLPVILWDERLTTTQVEKGMKAKGLSRKKRSQHTDSMSATVLLQSYLDLEL